MVAFGSKSDPPDASFVMVVVVVVVTETHRMDSIGEQQLTGMHHVLMISVTFLFKKKCIGGFKNVFRGDLKNRLSITFQDDRQNIFSTHLHFLRLFFFAFFIVLFCVFFNF